MVCVIIAEWGIRATIRGELMSDFEKSINASDLIDWIMCAFPDWCVGDVREIVDHVNEMPSAQPDLSSYSDKLWRNAYERGKAEAQAEIIRCRDCRHCKDITSIHGECESAEMWDSLFGEVTEVEAIEVHKDHYCGYAERRTDG